MLVAGSNSHHLGLDLARRLGLIYLEAETSRFADGELRVVLPGVAETDLTSLAEKGVIFVLQSLCHPVNDNLVELLLLLDRVKDIITAAVAANPGYTAASSTADYTVAPHNFACFSGGDTISSCKTSPQSPEAEITANAQSPSLYQPAETSPHPRLVAIIPYFGYSRQDRGEAVSFRLVVKLLEAAGVDAVVTVDLHSTYGSKFFTKTQLYNIDPAPYFAAHLANTSLPQRPSSPGSAADHAANTFSPTADSASSSAILNIINDSAADTIDEIDAAIAISDQATTLRAAEPQQPYLNINKTEIPAAADTTTFAAAEPADTNAANSIFSTISACIAPPKNPPSLPLHFATNPASTTTHTEEILVVSPDLGSIERARKLAAALGCAAAFVDKTQATPALYPLPLSFYPANAPHPATLAATTLSPRNKRCIIVDDICSTARTIIIAANILAANGAATIEAVITHGVFAAAGRAALLGCGAAAALPGDDNPEPLPFQPPQSISRLLHTESLHPPYTPPLPTSPSPQNLPLQFTRLLTTTTVSRQPGDDLPANVEVIDVADFFVATMSKIIAAAATLAATAGASAATNLTDSTFNPAISISIAAALVDSTSPTATNA